MTTPLATVLGDALHAIAPERPDRFSTAHAKVDAVIALHGEDGLADTIYETAPSTVPWELIADLLAIAIWQTSDNGKRITCDTERWLLQNYDARKVQIALNIEFYPFRDAADMERVLPLVAARFPQTAARCEELLASRRTIEKKR